jgi:hypothetical protein
MANGQFGPMASRSQLAMSKLGLLGSSAGAAAGTFGTLARGAAIAGSRFLGLLGPVGMVASIGFIAADALGLFGGETEETTVAYEDWVSALRQSGGDMRTVNGDVLSMVMAAEQLAPALRAGGREGMVAMQQLRTTLEPAKQRLMEIRQTNQDAWETRGIGEYNNLLGDLEDQSLIVTDALKDQLNLQGEWTENEVSNLSEVAQAMPGFERSIRRNGMVTDQFRQKLMALGASAQRHQRAELRPHPVPQRAGEGGPRPGGAPAWPREHEARFDGDGAARAEGAPVDAAADRRVREAPRREVVPGGR